MFAELISSNNSASWPEPSPRSALISTDNFMTTPVATGLRPVCPQRRHFPCPNGPQSRGYNSNRPKQASESQFGNPRDQARVPTKHEAHGPAALQKNAPDPHHE